MDYQYLNDVYRDQAALGSLGDTLNRNIADVARLRFQQSQAAQQNAINRAYLDLSIKELQDKRPLMQAQTAAQEAEAARQKQATEVAQALFQQQQLAGRLSGYRNAPNIMSFVQDPQSGPQMMTDLRTAGVLPQGGMQLTQPQLQDAVLGAIKANLMMSAAGQPATAGRMLEPISGQPGTRMVDPFNFNTLLDIPDVMTPYQKAQLDREKPLDEARIAAEKAAAAANTARADLYTNTIDTQKQRLIPEWARGVQALQNQGNSATNRPAMGPQAAPAKGPKIGATEADPKTGAIYRFKGGHPGDPSNWVLVDGGDE